MLRGEAGKVLGELRFYAVAVSSDGSKSPLGLHGNLWRITWEQIVLDMPTKVPTLSHLLLPLY